MLVDENKRFLISSFCFFHQQLYIAALLSVSRDIGWKPPIKVSNSSFFCIWFSVWFVNRQEIKRLELVYLESFLFELLETLVP